MMRRVVDRIHKQQCPNGPGEPGGSLDVVDRAQCVRGRTDGDQFRPRIHLLFEVVPIQLTGWYVHLYDAQRAAALEGERLPGPTLAW